MLKTAKIKFMNSKYNYETSVNGQLTDDEIKSYFVGKSFDVGTYPDEKIQKVIDCEVMA